MIEEGLFWIIAALCVVSALAVVVLKNPVHSALSLVGNLVGVAALYAMLQAHFLAMVQIMIYAGAIVVLVVFVIMLLDVKTESRWPAERLFGLMAGAWSLVLLAVLVPVIIGEFGTASYELVSLQGSVRSIGQLLFRDYVFLFQVAGVLVVSALVASVILARQRKGA